MANTTEKIENRASTQTATYKLTFDANGNQDFRALEFYGATIQAKGTTWGTLNVQASNDTTSTQVDTMGSLTANGNIRYEQERWNNIRINSDGFRGNVYIIFWRA
jgi:hypothetical protein